MNSIRVDCDRVDVFLLCIAHAQLESDYNRDGWLQERPSNKRRLESTGCQLSRLGYSNPYGWVDMTAAPTEDDDPQDEIVRFIYFSNALRYGLPLDEDQKRACKRIFTANFLAGFPQVGEVAYVN